MSLIQWPYLQWGDDSPVARHVSGNVCSKLKGHNGDPCVVLWGMFPNKKKEKEEKRYVGQILQLEQQLYQQLYYYIINVNHNKYTYSDHLFFCISFFSHFKQLNKKIPVLKKSSKV